MICLVKRENRELTTTYDGHPIGAALGTTVMRQILLSNASGLLRCALLVRVMQALVAVPALPQAGRGQILVGAKLLRDSAEILAKLLDRQPAPEPVAVVDD